MNLLNSKKGQAENYFAVIIFLFAFGLIAMLAFTIYDSMITEYQSTPYWDDDMITATGFFSFALKSYDFIMVLVMAVLMVGVGITSYKIAAPPVFFVISFIMAAFYGLVSYFFNYVFQRIVSDTVFNTVITFFPRTILICTNLHWVMLVTLVIGSITLYAKRDQGQFT